MNLRLWMPVVLLAAGVLPEPPRASYAPVRAGAADSPLQIGETIRRSLFEAQLQLGSEPDHAASLIVQSQATYTDELHDELAAFDASSDGRIRDGLGDCLLAVEAGDAPALAGARARVWTGLLAGSYRAVIVSLEHREPAVAQRWLPLREYRRANRFSLPGVDAALAVRLAREGALPVGQAAEAVEAELLDAYQARMTEALHEMRLAHAQGHRVLQAEQAALSEGYFEILAPEYAAQRGLPAAGAARTLLQQLTRASLDTPESLSALDRVEETLRGFRAAPLTGDERARRAGQLQRFLSLVPVEYARGVRDGEVIADLEVQEAITFLTGARAAFTDLRDLLEVRDGSTTQIADERLSELDGLLQAAASGREAADPARVEGLTAETLDMLTELMPPEWQTRDSDADFDVITTALDQMEAAVLAGEFAPAESARLEAYAVLESGPEARLQVFAPELTARIEALFWYGDGARPGLARHIADRDPAEQIAATRAALNRELAAGQHALANRTSPAATTTSSAVLVFREGLEAVLILAALMASLKTPENRHLRRFMWGGVGLASIATTATWILAGSLLASFARYGERLEAVVSLIAIAMLLLITNWFFHQRYWTDHIAGLHARKQEFASQAGGQALGMLLLGFSSVYREGFEVVIFLQALVLESGAEAVGIGAAVGLGITVLAGLALFLLEVRLPYRRLLIATGILIGSVLVGLAGQTVHTLQIIGWFPAHPLAGVVLPAWVGVWGGLYPTVEGIGLQLAVAAFVIGSYWLAERRRMRAPGG